MDNFQKVIMIGVGIFITVIIISVVLLIVNTGDKTIKKSMINISTMSQIMQNQMIKEYNMKIKKGSEVQNIINKYYDGSQDMSIVFTPKVMKNGINVGYNYTARVGDKYLSSYTSYKIEAKIESESTVFVTPSQIMDFGTKSYDGTLCNKTPLKDFFDKDSSLYISSGNSYRVCTIKFVSSVNSYEEKGEIIGLLIYEL